MSGRWDVTFQQEVFESYDIEILFPQDYPVDLPKVYETSNKILHSGDMHFSSPDWHACLFVSHQRWEVWPIGTPFRVFLEIPVHNFFLGQAHFAAYGYWPGNRERSHADKGIIEYYREKFRTEDSRLILQLLLEAKRPRSSRQKKCPCNNKTPLRNCHGVMVKKLRDCQDRNLMNEAIQIFGKL